VRIKDATAVLPVFGSPHGASVHAELAELIASKGALLSGHFRLQSGLHTPYFLRFGQLAYEPAVAARIAERCASQLVGSTERPSVVLCAETASRFLGAALAESIGAELAIAAVDERRQPRAELVAGALEGRREVVVVTDVVTTGRSVAPLVEMARAAPGAPRVRLAAFACLDPRGIAGALAQLRVEGGCLLEGRWTSYAASDCALCREGVELVPAYEFN
jgi:orotate phosphoribosyltransferase